MILDICSPVLQWHSYVRRLLMLHYSKKVADGLCRAQPVTVAQCDAAGRQDKIVQSA